MSLIGEVSNAIAAVCALVSIYVTIRENKRIGKQADNLERRRHLSTKFDELCVGKVVLAIEELERIVVHTFSAICKDYAQIENESLYNAVQDQCDKLELSMRYLKLFDKSLYRDCTEYIERIQDVIAESFNSAGDSNKYRFSVISKRSIREISKFDCNILERLHNYENHSIWGD